MGQKTEERGTVSRIGRRSEPKFRSTSLEQDRAIERARSGNKGDVKGGATARAAMEKSMYVRVIEGEKVRGDCPIKYFLFTASKVPFESQRV